MSERNDNLNVKTQRLTFDTSWAWQLCQKLVGTRSGIRGQAVVVPASSAKRPTSSSLHATKRQLTLQNHALPLELQASTSANQKSEVRRRKEEFYKKSQQEKKKKGRMERTTAWQASGIPKLAKPNQFSTGFYFRRRALTLTRRRSTPVPKYKQNTSKRIKNEKFLLTDVKETRGLRADIQPQQATKPFERQDGRALPNDLTEVKEKPKNSSFPGLFNWNVDGVRFRGA
ncbi:hypothetical protein DFH06DRAFT_1137596 [Mycena polygramma]|nr:hypothetical protein DFH06DRAFT_1137596 [Mycena polygramma]